HKLRTIPQKSPKIRRFQVRTGTIRDTFPIARNQFAGNSTRVRIPLSAPYEDDHEKSDRLFLVQILIFQTKPLKRNGRSIEMEYHDKQTGKNIDVFTTILYNRLRTGSLNKNLTEES
ncbi:MAG: hypothetical protein IJA67_12195, partial [Oscillospiraceae bacterium]|nr:hypothetical protein [Oscillospiraceae bacterium]